MRLGVLPALALLAALTWAGVGRAQEIVFRGVCDGSAAVALSDREIATIDDEKEPRFRTFGVQGGQPLAQVTIPGVSDRGSEPDFEAGTVADGRSLWIGSHGRDSKGRFRREREVLLVAPVDALSSRSIAPDAIRRITSLPEALRSWGQQHNLPMRAAFGPPGETRPELAAEKRGVNIESLAYHPERREVLIGFRNPLPHGKALVAPMRNVEAVLGGADAVFGDPIPLDLGKRGLRDMVWSERHRAMLLIAGPSGETGSFALYRWGAGPPSPLPWTVPLPARFHPETVVAIPESNDILVLSDDGDRRASTNAAECRKDEFKAGVCTCKNIRERFADRLRSFRGIRMTIEP
jgi:hypothetical protein